MDQNTVATANLIPMEAVETPNLNPAPGEVTVQQKPNRTRKQVLAPGEVTVGSLKKDLAVANARIVELEGAVKAAQEEAAKHYNKACEFKQTWKDSRQYYEAALRTVQQQLENMSGTVALINYNGGK